MSMRATQIGCSVGMGKMCLTKKVLSSTTCHMSMNCEMARTRIQEQVGSSHLVYSHDCGVNCSRARFSFPERLLMLRMDSQ